VKKNTQVLDVCLYPNIQGMEELLIERQGLEILERSRWAAEMRGEEEEDMRADDGDEEVYEVDDPDEESPDIVQH
jgi:hypothetical protein